MTKKPSVPKLVTAVNEAIGAGAVHTIPKSALLVPRPVLPTLCPTLDLALGTGGWPYSRLTIISGAEATGKTTLALHAVVAIQKLGGVALFLDHEHKLDLWYAQNIGVNITDVIWSEPKYLERSFKIIDGTVTAVAATRAVPVLVVMDSINAAIPKSIMESDFDDKMLIAAQARVMSYNLPKLMRAIEHVPVVLLWTSQIRSNITTRGAFKQLVAGGNAPRYYSSLVVELIRKGFYKENDKPLGSNLTAKVTKSSVSVPFKEAEFRIIWGEGIDYNHSLCETAIKAGVMNRSGSWYEFDTHKWQGRKGLLKKLEKDPDIIDDIEKAIAARRPRPP